MNTDHEAERRKFKAHEAEHDQMKKEFPQKLLDLGVMRIHTFKDGRTLRIQRRHNRDREVYCWVLHSGGKKHEDAIGFHRIEECEALAKFLFGFKEWNRFDGELYRW